MNCADYTKLASTAQDAAVSVRHRVGMFFHHLICIYCRRFAAQLAAIRHQLPKNDAVATMPAEMRAEIARKLRDGQMR